MRKIHFLIFINLLFIFNKYMIYEKKITFPMGIGDWGLGIGDWGLGIGDWAQSPMPNPQSPNPNPQYIFK